MSFQQLITRWLAAQAMQAVKREVLSPAEEAASTEERPALTCAAPPERPAIDIGFVFAMPMEAAGVVDLLKQKKTTKGDGRIFHTGLFGKFRVALVQSGVGQDKAGKAAEVMLDVFSPKRLVSAGYGGGLSKRLKRFAVCVPEIVIRESDGATLDLSDGVPQILESSNPDKLALLTTDFVAASPRQKSSLKQRTGAEVVDMETWAVADLCRRRGAPLLAVRIILDTAEEELPKDVRRILKDAEIGGARLVGSLLGSLFKRPSSMMDLFTLKQHALSATDRLAKFLANELDSSGDYG